MTYADPHYLLLLLLIPLLIVFLLVSSRLKKRALAKFGNLELIRKLMKSISRRRRFVKNSLILLALTAMIIAAARPQFGTRMREVSRKGVDIMIVLDTSMSMLAEDVAPNRLERAKHEVSNFIRLLQGDRIGLVCFAGVPFVQCPLTLDYGAARIFLDVVNTGLIPVQGTAIGDAVRLAVNSFDTRELKYKVIILITDGEDHNTKPEEAAEFARDNGVVIYTIGIGTLEGNPIPVKDNVGTTVQRKKAKDGSIVISKLNETTLLKMAAVTSGKYHRAVTGDMHLDTIYEHISAMEKRDLSSTIETFREDRFQFLLFFAILLLAIEPVISERRITYHEWTGRFK